MTVVKPILELPLECEGFQASLEARAIEGWSTDLIGAEQHVLDCAECSLAAETLNALFDDDPPTAQEEADHLGGAWLHIQARSQQRRGQRRLALTLACLAPVAVAALWLVFPADNRGPIGTNAVLLAGEVAVGDEILREGEVPPDRNIIARSPFASLRLFDGATVRALASTEFMISRSPRGDRILHLKKGRVEVDVKTGGDIQLSLRTTVANFTVAAAQFGLRCDSEQCTLGVERGRVVVSSAYSMRETKEVHAGETLRITKSEAAETPAPAPRKSLKLPRPARPSREGTAVSLPRPAGLVEILRSVRECRRQSDWRCAAEGYREIRRRFARRPEATLVLLPLAELELERLDAADKSLAHYSAYVRIAPRGELVPEAMVGQARAATRLGKRELSAQVLDELVRRFPSSLQAKWAREQRRGPNVKQLP